MSLRPPLGFDPRPRRLSTPTDAFELHPDVRSYGTTLKSLAKQLSFCYVANCRAATPCRLYLTGLTGAMGEVVERCCSGMANWAVIASEKPYIELLAEQKSKLVYLTADSGACFFLMVFTHSIPRFQHLIAFPFN